MTATVSALLLLAAASGPGVHRTGSAQFQVSVSVVAPLRASAPATVTLSADAAAAPVSSGARWIARLAPSASIRGGGSAVLVGAPGEPMRGCRDALVAGCDVLVPLSSASAAGRPVVVVAFLPDGAPPAVLER